MRPLLQFPAAGSAYSYVREVIGERASWLVGWNLLLEYCVSASAVARAWADHAAQLAAGAGLPLPR